MGQRRLGAHLKWRRASAASISTTRSTTSWGGVRGGVSNNVSLALNWYFNPYVLLSLNYVHAEVDNLDDQGNPEGGTVDGVAMRLRWEL